MSDSSGELTLSDTSVQSTASTRSIREKAKDDIDQILKSVPSMSLSTKSSIINKLEPQFDISKAGKTAVKYSLPAFPFFLNLLKTSFFATESMSVVDWIILALYFVYFITLYTTPIVVDIKKDWNIIYSTSLNDKESEIEERKIIFAKNVVDRLLYIVNGVIIVLSSIRR